MELLKFVVRNQNLSGGRTKLISGSIDYVEAFFDFRTSDWNGLDKWAHFSKGGTTFDVNLVEDKITREMHLNLEPGVWEVKLHGDANENGEVSMRITTDTAHIVVDDYGELHEGGILPEIAASAAEQIAAKAQNAVDVANAVKAAAESGEFNGEPGADGKTPQKGIDYWTEEDKAEIIAEASEGIESGADGFSPTIETRTTSLGTQVIVTDANGTKSFVIKNGKDGEDGESPTVDVSTDGERIYVTATNPDGTIKAATIEVPEDGTDGKDGADGKSAYQYAVDGGYSGTEEEFAEMAAIDPREFVFTVSGDSENGYTSDKTYDEILEAINSGRTVKLNDGGVQIPFVGIDGNILMFGLMINASESEFCYIAPEGIELYYGMVTIKIGDQEGYLNNSVDFTETINQMISAMIPTALKNPNALTFTGAVSGTYDGSSAKTINIPTIAGPQGETGATGERGTGILVVTTAPSSYTTATGGFTPTYRIALSTVLSQAKVDKALVGDMLKYSYYTYPVGYVDGSYVYLGTRVSIRGATGAAGAAGADGYTPVRGTDYWTEADKAEIKAYVDEAILGGEW